MIGMYLSSPRKWIPMVNLEWEMVYTNSIIDLMAWWHWHKPCMTWYTCQHSYWLKDKINTYRLIWESFSLQNDMLFCCNVHPKWDYFFPHLEVHKAIESCKENFLHVVFERNQLAFLEFSIHQGQFCVLFI